MSIYWDNYYYDWVKGESIVCNYLVQKPTSLQISFHKYNLTKHFPTRSNKLLEFAELNKACWTYIHSSLKLRQPFIMKILSHSWGLIEPLNFGFWERCLIFSGFTVNDFITSAKSPSLDNNTSWDWAQLSCWTWILFFIILYCMVHTV